MSMHFASDVSGKPPVIASLERGSSAQHAPSLKRKKPSLKQELEPV
eukprot:CAMPEP_0204910316 /NCGR_PEP_ID=MMETSP1397-20131031/8868_1 /ASSEMBLY_ACC=CAM_ASM_000891 /TAXON_ID=49980 /ORGANISM="Climacostomum Climacostomum virens, Strain Stock W-24" /LENGTH=45 /DNA_ID= /DNA_START= /DNA_END= /DNA_ORIENTATION=